jgi:hypothetical protein
MQKSVVTSSPEGAKVLPGYVIVSVEPEALSSVVEQLRREQGITLVAPASGRHDLIVQLNSSKASKVSEFVNKLRSMRVVRATKTTSLLMLAAC